MKDNISVSGVPMTCGSNFFTDYTPDTDATVVMRILEEGGDIVSILNMDDFAWSGSGGTSVFGPVLNPHNTDYLAGGSSAGSGAALFYDDIDVTLGCDQGGSIRIPAAWCGVVGLKPTFGLVPYTGIVAEEATFDHVGPMARSVDQVALMLDVIAGKDPLDQRQGVVPKQDYTGCLGGSIDGTRIGVLAEGFGAEGAEEEVDNAVRRALAGVASLGAEVIEVSIPYHLTSLSIYRGVIPEGSTTLLRAWGLGNNHMGFYDAHLGAAIRNDFEHNADKLPPDAKLTLLLGSYLNHTTGVRCTLGLRILGRPYVRLTMQPLRRWTSWQCLPSRLSPLNTTLTRTGSPGPPRALWCQTTAPHSTHPGIPPSPSLAEKLAVCLWG